MTLNAECQYLYLEFACIAQFSFPQILSIQRVLKVQLGIAKPKMASITSYKDRSKRWEMFCVYKMKVNSWKLVMAAYLSRNMTASFVYRLFPSVLLVWCCLFNYFILIYYPFVPHSKWSFSTFFHERKRCSGLSSFTKVIGVNEVHYCTAFPQC